MALLRRIELLNHIHLPKMLDDIKRFYEKVMLHQIQEDSGGEEIPITFTHVFHKEYPRLVSISLPTNTNEDSFLETILEKRESVRTFSDQPLELQLFAQILRSCRIVDPKHSPERRTYPSGGARFPVEIYLASFDVNPENSPESKSIPSLV